MVVYFSVSNPLCKSKASKASDEPLSALYIATRKIAVTFRAYLCMRLWSTDCINDSDAISFRMIIRDTKKYSSLCFSFFFLLFPPTPSFSLFLSHSFCARLKIRDSLLQVHWGFFFAAFSHSRTRPSSVYGDACQNIPQGDKIVEREPVLDVVREKKMKNEEVMFFFFAQVFEVTLNVNGIRDGRKDDDTFLESDVGKWWIVLSRHWTWM